MAPITTMYRLSTILLIAQMVSTSFAQQRTSSVGTPLPPPTVQQSSQKPDEDVVKITTNLVQVDAVVTDSHGKIVADLKPEEVEIFEDGRKQKITHFNYYVTKSVAAVDSTKPNSTKKPDEISAAAPAAALRREDVRRTIAIVVDDLCLSFESIQTVKSALKKFVVEQLEPSDLVAIIRTRGGIGTLQQFTSDKRQLAASVDRIRWNPVCADDGAFKRLGLTLLKVPETGDGDHAQKGEAFREEIFSVGTLGAMGYVVRGLRELPGRKSVLLVSDGIKIFNPEDQERSNRVQRALESLTDLANRASVVIYTMDARGLLPMGLEAQDGPRMMSDSVSRADQRGLGRSISGVREQMAMRRTIFYESQNGLNYLAQQTGGIAIRNKNDLSAGIKSVLDDQSGYYLIGYRPAESTFDPKTGRRRLHHLSLKVTRAGDFNVRMRNGFFGVADEEKKAEEKTAASQLLEAITSPFGATGVRLQLTSLFANDATSGSLMRSLLHIDANDLTFKDGPGGTHQCVFDVLAMTFGDNGVAVDYNAQTYTLDLPEKFYQRALSQGLVYNVTMPIKKTGAYQFRVSLRDAGTNRIGSAGQFVEVPDLTNNRLALSGIVLRGISSVEWENIAASKGTSPASWDAADPNQNSASRTNQPGDFGNPEASPAVRRLTRGMYMRYGFIVYNAQLDKKTNQPKLTIQMQLLREGQVVFAGNESELIPSDSSDPKRLSGGGAIQLGTDLAPGEYMLRIVVRDLLADPKQRAATQWMDFEIVK